MLIKSFVSPAEKVGSVLSDIVKCLSLFGGLLDDFCVDGCEGMAMTKDDCGWRINLCWWLKKGRRRNLSWWLQKEGKEESFRGEGRRTRRSNQTRQTYDVVGESVQKAMRMNQMVVNDFECESNGFEWFRMRNKGLGMILNVNHSKNVQVPFEAKRY